MLFLHLSYVIRQNFILLLLMVPVCLQAQRSLFNTFPLSWQGDTALFRSVRNGIQSQGRPQSETIACSTKLDSRDAWYMECQLRCNFTLSSSNFPELLWGLESAEGKSGDYLVLRWSHTRQSLQLLIIQPASTRLLMESRNGIVRNGKSLRVRLLCQSQQVEMHTDTSLMGNWHLEGRQRMPSPGRIHSLGFAFKHTSTRASLLFIEHLLDLSLPLRLVSSRIRSAKELELIFSKPFTDSMQCQLHPSWTGLIQRIVADTVFLDFAQPLPVGRTQAFLLTMADQQGTIRWRDSIFLHYLPDVQRGQVRLSEVMPDPQENKEEFVELYNASSDTLSTEGMRFCDAHLCAYLPSVLLFPGARYVFTASDPRFSMPSLNNQSDQLYLWSPAMVLLDTLKYDSRYWKGQLTKGVSLESTLAKLSCASEDTWFPSQQTGGSPGLPNSCERTDWIWSAQVMAQNKTLECTFNLPLDTRNPYLQINGATLSGVFLSPYRWVATLDSIPSDELKIEIHHENSCFAPETTLQVLPSFYPEPETIRMTEILFNPKPYGSDYLELKNTGNRNIYIDTLLLSNGGPSVALPLQYTWAPGEVLVCSADTAWVQAKYMSDCPAKWFQCKLPLFPDSGVHLVLKWKEIRLDECNVSERFHYKQLESFEGVALERQQWTGPWEYQWKSCLQEGAPGCSPKISTGQLAIEEGWVLNSLLLSPDDPERSEIRIAWEGETAVKVSAEILTINGNHVSNLASSVWIQPGQFLRWDGWSKDRQVPTGWYVLKVITEHPDKKNVSRKVVSVIRSN